MKRDELFTFIQEIEDPVSDYPKILSALHYTHFFLMDKHKKVLAVYDLTPIQSNVLSIIVYKHPTAASLEEIKEMVLEPGSDVSRTVVRLTQKGFVKKVIDPKNKRKLAIAVTPEGLDVFSKINSDNSFLKNEVSYSIDEAVNFINFLKKLREETN
ncbi:MAG: transcriptional regulator [Bacteroidota bacterium]|jgi:DNA-binding MarR family transcriptional regulator|nr:transcriptional regulator [Bacteroidota bacterium]